MGMAASQARYLALTARKTNTEWEGQQINQARTALANQSANLFNQLLGMEVPNAPKTSDYTKLQYSYSDGNNDSVFEDWHQINTANPNYNYVVSHYYMADVFTGIKRQLVDPEVQLNNVLNKMEYDKNTTRLSKDENQNLNVTYKINNYDHNQTYDKITEAMIAGDEQLKNRLQDFEEYAGLLKNDGSLSTDGVYGYKDDDSVWHFFVANDYNRIKESDAEDAEIKNYAKQFDIYEKTNGLITPDGKYQFDGIYSYKKSDEVYGFINTADYTEMNQEVVDADAALKTALTAYETENGLLDDQGNLTFDGIYGYQDETSAWQFINVNDANTYTKVTEDSINYVKNESLVEALTKYETEHNMLKSDGSLDYDGVFGYQDSEGDWHFFFFIFQTQDSYMKARDNIDYSISYGPSFVGNSELTELNQLVVDRNNGLDQVTDLAQILKDCPDSAIKNYVSFDDYGNLQYEGKGIYTFNLFGQTYYTTKDDLMESYNNARSINTIDDQVKLTYYSASYIPKKIEETTQALIEKDADGRFKNVKFENDSAVYTLNVEEVLNEQAYNDAMNAYLNKKQQYEKTIADINAKTSIIQKEDRTLELRLKQLDTEQHALATEMDAVKKVIKDNVEKTFKTFSD